MPLRSRLFWSYLVMAPVILSIVAYGINTTGNSLRTYAALSITIAGILLGGVVSFVLFNLSEVRELLGRRSRRHPSDDSPVGKDRGQCA